MDIKNIKMKRICTLFLAFVALFVLASCGTGEAMRENGEDTELSLSSLEIIPADSTAGQTGNSISYPSEFTVLCELGTEKDLFASVDASDTFSKTVFERNAQLFDAYGITLNEIVEDDITTRVTNDMLSEDKEYDMLLISAPSSASLISAGALADLEAIAGWTPSAKGYSEQTVTDLSVGGRSFLAAGDATPSTIRSASAVLVNTELAEKVAPDGNILTIAKNGHFTYETMQKYSASYAEISSGENAVPPQSAVRVGAEDALGLYLSGGGSFFVTDPVTDVLSSADFYGENSRIYSEVMALFGIYVEEDVTDHLDGDSGSVTPLFTVASLGELEALCAEGAPFAALPMPKMSILQEGYLCNIDLSKAVFTALPLGSGETEAAVMNLIYSLSSPITEAVLGACDPLKIGTARMVCDSMCAEVLTLFGFGDLQSFMISCVNERTSAKVFAMRASERSTAATAALSIISEKFASVNNNG